VRAASGVTACCGAVGQRRAATGRVRGSDGRLVAVRRRQRDHHPGPRPARGDPALRRHRRPPTPVPVPGRHRHLHDVRLRGLVRLQTAERLRQRNRRPVLQPRHRLPRAVPHAAARRVRSTRRDARRAAGHRGLYLRQDDAVEAVADAVRAGRPASPTRTGRSGRSCSSARPAWARPSWPEHWPRRSSAAPTRSCAST
jgi:hypothetical protein